MTFLVIKGRKRNLRLSSLPRIRGDSTKIEVLYSQGESITFSKYNLHED